MGAFFIYSTGFIKVSKGRDIDMAVVVSNGNTPSPSHYPFRER
jgi:hypothetical protein